MIKSPSSIFYLCVLVLCFPSRCWADRDGGRFGGMDRNRDGGRDGGLDRDRDGGRDGGVDRDRDGGRFGGMNRDRDGGRDRGRFGGLDLTQRMGLEKPCTEIHLGLRQSMDNHDTGAILVLKASRKTGTTWLECLVSETLEAYCNASMCQSQGSSRDQEGLVLNLPPSIARPTGWSIRFIELRKHVTNIHSCVRDWSNSRVQPSLVFLNIYRDPRDTLVSLYHWKKPSHLNVSAYARMRAEEVLANILYFYRTCHLLKPPKVKSLTVNYGALKADTVGELALLGTHLGLDSQQFNKSIMEAEHICSVESMKKAEENGTLKYENKRIASRRGPKVREAGGKVAAFLDDLDQETLVYINTLAYKTFRPDENLSAWFKSLPYSST